MLPRVLFILTLLFLHVQGEAQRSYIGRQEAKHSSYNGVSKAQRFNEVDSESSEGQGISEEQRFYEGQKELQRSFLNAFIQGERSVDPLMCSVLTGCSLNCPNGRVKNINGCDTCQCRVCAPDPCLGLICLYGKARDSDGCIVCGCYQPCDDINCPAGQECQVVKKASANTYSGQCIQTVTTPPCRPVTCTNTCRYGFKGDNYGCRTCNCWDPCESSNCGVNGRCVVDPCVEAGTCRDYGYYCVANGQLGREVSEDMPQTTSSILLQTAMRQCCSNAGLSGSCLTTCVTNSTRLLADYRSCFPTNQIWTYLSCISAAHPTVSKPSNMSRLANLPLIRGKGSSKP